MGAVVAIEVVVMVITTVLDFKRCFEMSRLFGTAPLCHVKACRKIIC